jgi:hypothetical protein
MNAPSPDTPVVRVSPQELTALRLQNAQLARDLRLAVAACVALAVALALGAAVVLVRGVA